MHLDAGWLAAAPSASAARKPDATPDQVQDQVRGRLFLKMLYSSLAATVMSGASGCFMPTMW
jgi:hypothetical protein